MIYKTYTTISPKNVNNGGHLGFLWSFWFSKIACNNFYFYFILLPCQVSCFHQNVDNYFIDFLLLDVHIFVFCPMSAIFRMAAILKFQSGSIANILKFALIYYYAKFDASIIKPTIISPICWICIWKLCDKNVNFSTRVIAPVKKICTTLGLG